MDLATHEIDTIKELTKGSYFAFTKLYKRYAPSLYGFIFRLTKSKSTADDLLQETFITIWTKRKEIQPNKSFKAFLFQIAHNKAISVLRKQITAPQMLNYLDYRNQVESQDQSIEQILDYEDFLKQLEKAKSKLTPRQRLVFTLCKEDHHPVEEVAQLLGIAPQSVRNQLSAAMKIFRKELGSLAILLLLIL